MNDRSWFAALVLRGGAATGVGLAVLGCGPPARPPKAPTPVSAPPRERVPVESPPPPAVPAALAPTAAPSPPIDIRSPEGAVAFVAESCRRAAAGDGAWVAAHVAFPLLGNGVVSTDGGEVLLGRIADEQAELATSSLCKAPAAVAREAAPFETGSGSAGGTIQVGQHAYRVRFEIGAGGEPRLVEASYRLPELGKTPKKPRRPFVLNGRVEGASPRGEVFAAIIEPELKKEPACIYEHASRSKSSASMFVVASKREGAAATARVFASTAVPALSIACFERQLDRAYAAMFRGIPFEVRYFLMLGLPLSKDEIDSNANMIMSAP